MTAYEWVALAYFAAFSLISLAAPVPWRRRVTISAVALSLAIAVWLCSLYANTVFRAWVPHAYLMLGYWLPGALAGRPARATRFEERLAAADARVRPRLPHLAAPFVHLTEVAYLLCYPLVPVAFGLVWAWGTPADVSRFWVAVLVAGYACYVSLPWLLSRPPRLADASLHPPNRLRAINVAVLGRVSHELNTFPSGHVAVSGAAALALALVSPAAGFVVGLFAIAIAVGAAAGRYHYLLDVVLGMVTAFAALAVSSLIGAP